MATVPAKSHQPLHNFSLPFLKWGQRSHVNNSHRCRRLLSDAATTTTDRRPSPSDSEDPSDSDNNNNNNNSHQSSDKLPRSRSRTGKGIKEEVEEEREVSKVGDVEVGEEPGSKPWNLRPRRPGASLAAISAVPNHTVGTGNGNGTATAGSTKSGRLLRGSGAPEENEEEEKKRKLWISLSKEEIEEDVYALTGSKPARRPKKRNKTVQKQIDNIFPGLYLVGMSADSYRV